MKMRDIKGKKVNKNGMVGEDMAGDIVYPSFYISIEHLPEAKDWKMGKTYEVTLRIKQTGLNLREHEGKGETQGSAEFEITGICVCGEDTSEDEKYSRIKKGSKKAEKS